MELVTPAWPTRLYILMAAPKHRHRGLHGFSGARGAALLLCRVANLTRRPSHLPSSPKAAAPSIEVGHSGVTHALEYAHGSA